MTRLFNDPTAFADELIAGFVAANRGHVRPVTGGVVRATRSEPGTVALVIGGGSGHYPAFGGLVGPGIAHGAAMGNLFASPSTQQVLSVARAAEHGGGVLLSYGNYAGDVLNFDAAEAQLNADGIRTRTVRVTDDISSAPREEKHKRRGIAGDLTVFKVAGAASEAGYDLDEMVRVAELANERTRSFGVAFTGCTLPGAEEPLFTVPEGRMAVGLGIHGEPGIGETDIPTADGLAELFVETLLGELPDGIDEARGQRVVPILNGLGSVKYEELYVVYGGVARRLEEAGLEVVSPQVGEFCTSFDMAGASLTLLWLDEELEGLWSAAADTPGYRTGSVAPRELDDTEARYQAPSEAVMAPASEASRESAARVVAAVEAIATVIDENVEELGRIDAVAGDGDHGIGMQRGSTAAAVAARETLAAGAGAGTVLVRAADAWSDRAGGTSGALWGVALRALGTRVGDEGAPDVTAIAEGVRAALDGIRTFGKAEVGDKTMVDAIVPFVEVLAERAAAGDPLAAAWDTAARAATEAAAATADLLPRMGRARPHAERSLGTPDAGAHSFGLVVTAVAAVISGKDSNR
ncbi:dihydroxyacetone kinase family protein [Homoserinibacter sp. GY 40078]|uniref:dihydroxyacetone kinase family protein n=1 Tax=Homoserinibacter sp. GY 40078 TaxID=2603275 RepID=UPI0011CA71F2|nr:dihydroxyacetone kinase family protein [Homoserinibacter sp. GY 40078]TXK19423.1 dihydroxyacetone kinase family protein [Homoserinibacter sp. GY 40078]